MKKKRPICVVCGSPVSSRRCDAKVGFSHPPRVVFPTSQTGQSEEEKLMERLRAKGWVL